MEEPANPLSRSMRSAIARNLADARKLRGWSMRELASRSGLSKSLVARIEQEDANPSLEALWQLVAAVGISFSELVRDSSDQARVVRRPDRRVFDRSDLGMRVELVAALTDGSELYELVIPRDSSSRSHSHGVGTFEHVFVLSGAATLSTGGVDYRLGFGDLMTFPADGLHVYRTTARAARLLCIMNYGTDQPPPVRAQAEVPARVFPMGAPNRAPSSIPSRDP